MVASGVIARFAQIAVGFVVEVLILFLGAGRLDWLWAWTFLLICVATVAVNATLLRRTNLEVIAERGRAISHIGRHKLRGRRLLMPAPGSRISFALRNSRVCGRKPRVPARWRLSGGGCSLTMRLSARPTAQSL